MFILKYVLEEAVGDGNKEDVVRGDTIVVEMIERRPFVGVVEAHFIFAAVFAAMELVVDGVAAVESVSDDFLGVHLLFEEMLFFETNGVRLEVAIERVLGERGSESGEISLHDGTRGHHDQVVLVVVEKVFLRVRGGG